MKIKFKDTWSQLFRFHKIILLLLFVSLFFVVKSLPTPLPNFLVLTGKLFLINDYTTIQLALSTGFIASFIVWLLTVFLPEYKIRLRTEKVFISELSIGVDNIINMLVKLYKNCSTEEEWSALEIDDDGKLFDSNFEMSISRLDVLAIADLPYTDTNGERMLIKDYLKERFNQFYELLEYILVSYSQYMYSEEIEMITKVFQNTFMRNIIGKPSENIETKFSTKYGTFNETISLLEHYNTPKDSTPLFINAINRNSLMVFVKNVLSLQKMIYAEKSYKNAKTNKKNHYFSTYKTIGEYNICCFDEEIGMKAEFSYEDLLFHKDKVINIINDIKKGNAKLHEEYNLSKLRYNSIFEYLSKEGYIQGENISNINITDSFDVFYNKFFNN